MRRSAWFGGLLGAGLLAGALTLAGPIRADAASHALPAPELDAPATATTETALFAGGCFWGVQAVFQHVNGVVSATSGYSGGTVADPSYERVSSGRSGYAETVRVTFDPARVSYATLLRVFFSVALDPTELNRQGPDTGTQYRSALFVTSPAQERVARAYLAQLDAAHAFPKPIVTEVTAAGPFYPAEAYHQDYLVRHPSQPYIAMFDQPKVAALHTLFPAAWRDTPVLTTLAAR